MIRAIALAAVFAISLLAVPTEITKQIIPSPECGNNCPKLPWEK